MAKFFEIGYEMANLATLVENVSDFALHQVCPLFSDIKAVLPDSCHLNL